jgi:hypothetical protein
MRQGTGVVCALVALFAALATAQPQNLNVDLSGRWAKGRCEAVFRRGDYTFIGNGHYLEVYRNIRGNYTKLDDLLLPGPVKDVWVKGDLTVAYVACGEAGLRLVRLDTTTPTSMLVGVIGVLDTPGYASGVMHYGITAYVADGSRGLLIADVEDPANPRTRGTFATDGFARRAWVVNDSTVLVAADLAGLIAVKTKNPAQPVFLDSLMFSSAFPGQTLPEPRVYSVVVSDTVAYVAAGWGGMRTVNIKDPTYLKNLGRWTYGLPIEVRNIWISGSFVHLACGSDGFFSPINVSNPRSPSGPTFVPIHTGGYTTAVVTQQDTAYVADGYNGHLLVNISAGFQPFITDSVETADVAYGALISGNAAFIAAGKAGVKVLDLDALHQDRMEESATIYRGGEARALKKIGSKLYIADGTHGMSIYDIADPFQPFFTGEYVSDSDTCFDVDVSGSVALLANGKKGIRVVDVSVSIFELPGSPYDTRGNAKAVQIVKNKAFVADSLGVYVYDLAQLPSTLARVDSLPSQGVSMQALGLAVTTTGDSVFVANGVNGFLLWNRATRKVKNVNWAGRINDLAIREKTLFAAGDGNGLRIFDFSVPDTFKVVGYYDTEGRALKSAVAPTGGRVVVADGDDGAVVLQSSIYPKIAVLPASLNFGLVPPNYSRPLVLWVMNKGTTLLKVTGITVLGDASAFKFSRTSFTVAPGDTFSLVVRFEPKNSTWPALQVATAAINSNDPTGPVTAMTIQGEVGPLVTEGPYDPDPMTVALYHFDEADNTPTVTDASGNGLHGQVFGIPKRMDSARPGYGRQILFDRQDDRISVPFNSVFNVYNSPFTAETWFNLSTKPQAAYLLMRRGNGATRQWELALYSGNQGLSGTVWDANGSPTILTAGTLDLFRTDQWYHTAMTFDGDTVKLYLNGVLKDKKAFRKRLRFEATEALAVGGSTVPDAYFQGVLDEVRLSGVAREAWEFHVNRSRMDLDASRIDFGRVLSGYARSLPLKITNGGAQVLVMTSLSSTNSHVTISSSAGFTLGPGQNKTLTLTFRPISEEILGQGQGSQILIESSDPTFPVYSLPLSGIGLNSIPAGAYTTDAFTAGLWHFDETSGTTAFDSSAYGMNGILVNGAYFDSQKKKFDPGRSAHFDGANDFCKMAPVQGQFIGPRWGGMTVEGWFTVESIPLGRQILMRRGKDNAVQFEMVVDSTSAVTGRLVNTQGQIFAVSSKSMGNIQPRIWYHAAMVLNADTLSFYVNGNKTDTRLISGQIVGSQAGTAADTLSLLVGRDWEGRKPLLGNVDEVRLSTVARQPWEFNVNLARIESVDSLAFGTVLVTKTRTRKLWVKNTGIDKLVVDETAQTAPTLFLLDTLRFTVNPGDSQLVKVTFKPVTGEKQPQTGQITFRTNDPFWPNKTVQLYGTGAMSLLPAASYPNYPKDYPFTVVLYHLNEKADTAKTVADSSGNRLNGTLSGTYARVDSGRFGRAVQFTSGQIRTTANQKLNLRNLPDFTAELWFQMQAKPTTPAVLFRMGNDSGTGDSTQVSLVLGTGANDALTAWYTNVQLANDSIRCGPLNVGQWYHAAVTLDNDTMKLYLNAQLRRSKPFHGSLRAMKQAPIVSIGADHKGNQPFRGLIDEFRLSSIARKDWEMAVNSPTIVVDRADLNFANVLVQQSRVLNFWVMNDGDQNLQITSISSSAGQFTIPDSLKTFTLLRKKNKMISVTYTPTTVNKVDNADLSIASNDPANPVKRVQVSGNGAELKAPGPYSTDAHTLALYHFDQLKQDTVPDASGKNRHGFIKFDVRLVNEGVFSGGLLFDGSDGRVEVPSDTGIVFDYGTRSFTFECYFKTDTVNQTILFKGFADTLTSRVVDYGLTLDNEGRLSVDGFAAGGPRFCDGSWHHAAFAYNHFTKTGKLYGDGALLWSKTLTVLPAGKKAHDRPLVFGAAERQLRSFFRYFKGTLDEVRISDIAREPWEFQSIDYGIKLNTMAPNPPESEKQATLQFNVPIALQAVRVIVYFRNGGGSAYTSVDAKKINAATYEAALPGASVTLEGLEYYVEIQAGKQSYTYPLLDPKNNPKSISVKHAGIKAPTVFKVKQYQMFSVPFNLVSKKPDIELVDDFGPYDPYQWRLWWYHREKNQFISYVDSTRYAVNDSLKDGVRVPYTYARVVPSNSKDMMSYFGLTPGRSFFMISSKEMSFDVGSGSTVTTDSGFVMTVGPGWNMIGDPFNFEIKWDDCALSSGALSTLYYYRPEDGYHMDYPTLEPWKGYWIYNVDTLAADLIVLPRKKSGAKASPKGGRILAPLAEGEWLFKISAEADQAKDPENYAGVRHSASDGWDVWDRSEPPSLGDESVQLSFDNSGWKNQAGEYAADIRSADKNGHAWSFFVETRLEEKDASLAWTLVSPLPEGWEAYLFDLTEGNSINALKQQVKTYKTERAVPNVRRFKWVVGTKEYIQSQSEGISLEPAEFHLYQNYPNPFNPQTTVFYSLPKSGETEILIFNTLGQKVRTLVKSVEKAGRHEVIWDGKDERGLTVPSGVYLVRLSIPDHTAVRKMTVLK